MNQISALSDLSNMKKRRFKCIYYILILNKLQSFHNHFIFILAAIDFSSEGKYMALAERRDCKDFISIFACSNWELVKVSLY